MTRVHYLVKTTVLSIYTGHANLVYIYDSRGQKPGLLIHAMSKLMRWAIKVSEFLFIIEHLKGLRDVWAYMLTRWAVQPSQEISTSHKLGNNINGPYHSFIIRITGLADNSLNQLIATPKSSRRPKNKKKSTTLFASKITYYKCAS